MHVATINEKERSEFKEELYLVLSRTRIYIRRSVISGEIHERACREEREDNNFILLKNKNSKRIV